MFLCENKCVFAFCRDSDSDQYLYNEYPNDIAKCHIVRLKNLMYVGMWYVGKKCQVISYDNYIERFSPQIDRYKWIEESHNI